VVLILPSPIVAEVETSGANSILPNTIQFPAVKDILVTLVCVEDEIDWLLTEDVIVSPCLPAAGELPEVPPTILVLGSPVQLVNVPLEGVPNTGVVNEGDVAPTNDPLPVMFAANAVATPVPNEAIELIGSPVQ
jgi:hypothetical protein